MKKRGGGKIITIGSMTSIFGFGITSAYSATKGAVVQLAKSLAVAWGADNIQVNAVLPGWVKTEMTTQSRSIPGLEQQVMQRTPANRWGTESDFEGVAAFLGSAASDFVTGIAIPVDGGFSGTLFIFDPPE
jgi:2-deoxy-D-gluconate 3-dehydrogenase